jgi:hypothetical protein
MSYFIMFLVSVLLGLLFALRTRSIVSERPYFAASWTFLSVFLSCLITTYILSDVYQIFPISLGQAVGTFIVMKFQFFRPDRPGTH